MALSAFHERCETHGVPLMTELGSASEPDTASDAFALQHYTKAIRLLRERLTNGTQSYTVTLLSCILFITLEFLRGNAYSAITHLRSGLGIIRSRLPSNTPSDPLQEQPTPSDAVAGGLGPTFARLSLLQSLYGQPRSSAFGIEGRGPFVELLDIDVGPPLHIDSLEHARCPTSTSVIRHSVSSPWLITLTSRRLKIFLTCKPTFSNSVTAGIMHFKPSSHARV